MKQLPIVEEAKATMQEGKTWPVMKWLREKKRVRKLADDTNAALDALNRETKAHWPDGLRLAFEGKSKPADPEMKAFIERVKKADELAATARADAEATFDQAEKKMSTRLAREGAGKAIISWELHEQAIEIAERCSKAGYPAKR